MKNNILWDCHMHSSFSADSGTHMEDMILKAVSIGLKGVCFTEHLDPDYPAVPEPEQPDFSLDIPAYQNTLNDFKQKYRNTLDIRFGIELGLQPHLGNSFTELVNTYPFDFVIGSSHIVHGADPYYPEFFNGRKESDCYMEYFESILENLAAFSEMDVTDIWIILSAMVRTRTENTPTAAIMIFWMRSSARLSVKMWGLN